MKRIIEWFKESNRWMHVAGCAVLSLIFGWQAGVGAALTTEAKDVQAAKSIGAWDWYDFLSNVVGTTVGGLLHWLIFG